MSAVVKYLKLQLGGDLGASLQELAAFVIAVLVMLGVGCTAFHMLAPGGWLELLFDRSFAGGIAALLAFTMIGVSAWLVSGSISVTGASRLADIFVYVFAAAGLLYLFAMLFGTGP